MNRNLAIGLACLAAALGGCATSRLTQDGVPSSDGSASSSVATPASSPANVFGAEPNHYFGTGGP